MLAGPIVHDWDNWLEEHPDWIEIDFTERPSEIFDDIKPSSKTRMHEHWMGGEKGSVGEEHPVGRAHHREEIELEHTEDDCFQNFCGFSCSLGVISKLRNYLKMRLK